MSDFGISKGWKMTASYPDGEVKVVVKAYECSQDLVGQRIPE